MSSRWNMRLPVLPSAIIGPEVTKVTVMDRVAALLQQLEWEVATLLLPYLYYSEQLLQLSNISRDEYFALPSRSALFLLLFNELLTGYTLPKQPHVEFIGGVTASPAQSLDRGTEASRQLKAWADTATEGFAVCAFGTVLNAPDEQMIEKLFDLFEGLKIPVAFKLRRIDMTESLKSKLPKNVLVMEWLPQNDLLGHPNARLLISHAGTKGYEEAIYHGVPQLAFPFIIGQRWIAERLVALGFGRKGSLVSMTGPDIAKLGSELLADERCHERLKLISKLIKARKHPADVAADRVEEILQFGAEHLRPHASYQLSFLQFYMLDILFVLIAVIVTVVLVSLMILSCLIRCFLAKCFKTFGKIRKSKND